MAHLSEALPFLLGIGVRRFSIDPHYLPVVQRKVAAIRSDAAEALATELLELPLAETIGARIDRFMRDLPGRQGSLQPSDI
jgi:phosphoenolpyruvate-protein kinase (PTS system EI component)